MPRNPPPISLPPHEVLKRPLLSEKSTFASGEQKRFTFLVDPRATKTEIKAAVQQMYKVRVVGVNTVVNQSRDRVMKYGFVAGKVSKKAIVRVHADDTLELF